MLATAIVVFREVIEAALIVSVVAAATLGIAGRTRWLALGIGAGILGALLIALFASQIADAFSGSGQEIFNAGVLLVAVCMLGWHNVWMGSHGRQLAEEMRAVGRAIASGSKPLYAVAIAVGIAVLREGSEIVLFLYGIASGGVSATNLLIGGAIGLVAGTALGYALYRGLVQMSIRRLFSVTGVLILLLAAGLAAQAAKFLAQADYLPSLGNMIWDTSSILSDETLFGQMIHILIGYTARPSGIQLVFYVTTLLVIGGLMRQFAHGARHKAAKVAALIGGAALLSLGSAQHARADFLVDEPYAETGEAEVEYEGFRTLDRHADKNNEQGNQVSLGYGLNSFWHMELGGEVVREPGVGTYYNATAWENIIQLTEPGEYWADVGFLAEYDFAARRHQGPDEIEFEPIVEKDFGRFTAIVNLPFEHDIGTNAATGFDIGYGVKTLWRFKPEISPAIEAFGDLGTIGRMQEAKFQDHRIGPALVGTISLGPTLPGDLKYDAGYLWGLTQGAANGTIKFDLEYEFHF